jgi:recombination protein RecR
MYDGIVQDLIDEFGRLPGIGPKSAQRIAFHILQTPTFDVARLSHLLGELRERVRFCEICGNVSEQERCAICRDPRRDQTFICVVEDAKDVSAIERTREFRGLYHVLGGAISPIAGIGPDDLRITQLMQRLADGTVQEVILATNPNLEGRGDRDLPQPAAAHPRDPRDPVGVRSSGRRRPRVRRRGHPRARLRGRRAV